ncbi:MAG: RNA-binding S4 domain-containing protein [Candidatus Competibacteraceae bacterium]
MTGDEDPQPDTGGAEDRVRLDKWLWAARFFKTRALAAEAVTGGKVHVDDRRVKPAHAVRLGEMLRIQRGSEEYRVAVKALSNQRGPAKHTILRYEETSASRQQREELREQRRLQFPDVAQSAARPTKQDRRRIIQFIRDE